MKRIVVTALLVCVPAAAHAELWSPLDTVPKPNAIVGLDTSVTQGVYPNCSTRLCHARGYPNGNLSFDQTRLFHAEQDLLATLPLVEDYFNLGYFEYTGCNEAKVVQQLPPDPFDPETRHAQIYNAIRNARSCDQGERRYPNRSGGFSGCLTPTPQCGGDAIVGLSLTNGSGAIPGVTVTRPARLNVPCDRIPGNYNIAAALASRVAGFGWPAWNLTNDPNNAVDVAGTFCGPLGRVLNEVRTELRACVTNPAAFWDMTFLDGAWCDAATIESTACTTGALVGTCVCDSQQPGCSARGGDISACNTPFTDVPNIYKPVPGARQQVAICEAYDPQGRTAAPLYAQPDNVAHGGCRENLAFLFTDGWVGFTDGVIVESAKAVNALYRSPTTNESNMFVFSTDDATRMKEITEMIWGTYVHPTEPLARALSLNARGALRSSSRTIMQRELGEVLTRSYAGRYAGCAGTFDPDGDRVALHSFAVPGYDANGPVSSDYLGWPMRISWYGVQDDGTVDAAPIFETDWANKANAPATCGGGLMLATDSDYDANLLGPGGRFRGGRARDVVLDVDGARRQWGRAFSNGQSRPLVVERPLEWVGGGALGSAFAQHVNATSTRPRLIYVQSNGFVIGYHAGAATASGYDDAVDDAGREVFRYKPAWIEDPVGARHQYAINDLIQQPLLSGDLVVRELYGRFGGQDRFATVLIGNQGATGRGYFALDVTDPCAPRVLAEWQLPVGSYASAEPVVATVPFGGSQRLAVITTGGADGTERLYATELTTGNRLAMVDLPAGAAYPSAPVCVDRDGRGFASHCWVLREDGRLIRVALTAGGFGAVDDITPNGSVGGQRRYTTSPAAYFDRTGRVTLVYGSGDYENLTAPATANRVLKVVDGTARGEVDDVCVADANGNTSGIIDLGPGERVISAPSVAAGVVAFSVYTSATSGCVAGRSSVYAMNFESCADAIGAGLRPVARAIGDGLPTTPTLHRPSGTLTVRTSDSVTGAAMNAERVTVRTDSRRGEPTLLFWREVVDLR
ncbi:MAG: PilC/PilY family type IV pilus protein [Deltaproteobacteria bacterium]